MLWIAPSSDFIARGLNDTVKASGSQLTGSYAGGPMYHNLSISRSEPISAEAARLLAPDEARAPTAHLSPTKRAALITCINGDGTLHKCQGVWKPSLASGCDKPIFGVTVADLSREGMMTVIVLRKNGVARLTLRGSWFARTAATEMAEQNIDR